MHYEKNYITPFLSMIAEGSKNKDWLLATLIVKGWIWYHDLTVKLIVIYGADYEES